MTGSDVIQIEQIAIQIIEISNSFELGFKFGCGFFIAYIIYRILNGIVNGF